MSVIFNSFSEFKNFVTDSYRGRLDYDLQNLQFVDNSNGEIKRHINDIFLYISKDEFEKLIIDGRKYGDTERDILIENSSNVLGICAYINSPSLINFIMDCEPNIEFATDLCGNSCSECIRGDYIENTKILLERGLNRILNVQIYTNCNLLKERYVYPIHVLCAFPMCLETKLETLKLYKKHGVDLNLATEENHETALIMYLKELLEDQENDPFKTGKIDNLEINIIYELITKENIDMVNRWNDKPKILIDRLPLSEKQKEYLLTKY